MERASGKRENEGEEVSTLLGGLVRSFLWETFTRSGTKYTQTHTHRSTNTHVLTKQMRFFFFNANAGTEPADADGAEQMCVIVPHL